MDLPPVTPQTPTRERAHGRCAQHDLAHEERARFERAQSMVEYVGLGAIAATLVTGIAAVVDSAAGDHLGAAIARRLLAAISGAE